MRNVVTGMARIAVCCVLLFTATTIAAEEYWTVWIHGTDKDSFDGPALAYGKLDRTAALAFSNYTVVERNAAGDPVEAVQMLSGKPNFRYVYWYGKRGEQIIRLMEYWDGSAMVAMSEIVWDYDEAGRRLSAGRYLYPTVAQGGGPRQLLMVKVFTGSNYVVHDYRASSDPALAELGRKLDRMQASLAELQRLEKRGLLAKILGH
jgi:hypothetical protein